MANLAYLRRAIVRTEMTEAGFSRVHLAAQPGACSQSRGFGRALAGTVAALVLAGAGGIPAAAGAATGRSVAEIQINLCADPAQVVRALRLQPESGAATTIWLFDTRALELNGEGLRLRLRQKASRAELTLKVAGQDCGRVDPAVLAPHGKCEADLHGTSFDDVVSLVRRLNKGQIDSLLAPGAAQGAALEAALAGAMTKNQRDVLAARRAALGDVAPVPASITRLGPASVRAYGRPGDAVTVEVWTMPGGQQFVELSEKVSRDAAIARRTQLLEHIGAAGIAVCTDQASQARSKLEILAR
jgi:hypothetical protein